MSARKIAVLGGGGFIGKTYVAMNHSRFDEILVIDRFSGPAHPTFNSYRNFVASFDARKVITIVADVASSETFAELLADCDAVLLLHADTGTASSFASPSTTVKENVGVLVAAVETIRKHCKPDRTRVVFTSSRAVYGEGAWYCAEHGHILLDRTAAALSACKFEPRCTICNRSATLRGTRESDPLRPLSVYGVTKRAGEDLLAALLVQQGFDVRIVRYQNVYGPGQEITNPYTGVLNWFSTRLIQGETVEIYEQGLIQRDFIYVDDAARLLFEVQQMSPERPGFEPFVVNGGSGVAVSLTEVATILRDYLNSSSQIVACDKFRVGDVLGARADMTHAQRILGFAPAISHYDGLRRYSAWFREMVEHHRQP